jgi:hypothetical protein
VPYSLAVRSTRPPIRVAAREDDPSAGVVTVLSGHSRRTATRVAESLLAMIKIPDLPMR